jgi:Asp-tRNA(Asn)/Glu-tRNA(Gln) amidotransferase A subunit family amidase
VSVTRAQLDRIAALDGKLTCDALVMADVATAQAEAAEAEIAGGRYRGPLHGVPIAVKDLCWTQGFPTAAGMAIHKNYCPGEDATVVRRLREAGAVLLGKLQLTEGAYSDYHPSVTPPKNPWNADYWAGISSSGPAVAIVLASVIEAGRAVSGVDYQKILLRRLDLRGRIAALFRTIDLLLIPVHPLAPPTLAMIQTLGEQPELIKKLQRFVCPFDMSGHPTITLPGGFTAEGLPIAFQLVAAGLGEATLVRAGAAFQSVTSWHRRHPAPVIPG